ncbi:G-D-S-L family lipolytic protein [Polaribacter sp. SA4-10]|uniref:SGNH/GDSL hydrolase family protein n=1 Tax=Polaribacter sp. SA4-10 TaxID=754397 RepID=UPI000B3CD9AC|nr:SGNH/GDSL hydrolase family protein [Polaribacter sp. SA4-10]ARV07058.1 G-D-S-L family lipolytic protein [Polaribacter sp. SA4-10]
MKNYKYLGLFLLTLGFTSCNVNNELDAIQEEIVDQVQLDANGLDFSKYISIGASFTAGYTDGAMFKAAQENSFPNILAGKFGTEFNQPLMADNIGGLVYGGTAVQPPRFYFDGAGPARLPATPTTELTAVLSGPFNNFGAPGAKSFHLGVAGYGQLNPYFGRMASSPGASVMGDALAQSPTFFTLSEIGGNDVLGYALSGGSGIDQTGNFDPSSYGGSDITDPNVFAQVFSGMVTALTANGAKGVVANVPYITDLANFTTVPYNAIPLDAATAGQLNGAFAAYNGGLQQILDLKNANLLPAQVLPLLVNYDQAEVDRRQVNFVAGQNAVLMLDENLSNLTPINPGLTNMRQATADDLLLLASSTVLGTTVGGNPQLINGVSVPLADEWVLTPEEQTAIKTATDSYNTTIGAVAASNSNIALVDFKGVLSEASTGIMFDNYTMTTSLVTGGLVSLDGVHLTARGYALMANKILAAMDIEFGSNFTTATNGLAKAGDYPTNYSPLLR